jgi:hypothetical protein
MTEWRVTGTAVRSFLVGGEPAGILFTEISNWTGKVQVAPRSQLGPRVPLSDHS